VVYLFPRWTNLIPTAAAIAAPILGAVAVFAIWYWFSPWYTDVGYQPTQPVPFSHRLHAGELGMDCRYCHNTVEVAARAAIPPTETCMNCHRIVRKDSPLLEPIRKSAETGEPVAWVRVHQLPDYAYFDHSVHLAAGVGCATCHARVDEMDKVTLSAPLSMGWCLECHRNPAPNLRPRDRITDMAYAAAVAGYDPAKDPTRTRELVPPEHCSGCHR
jgi:hypothetical protein